MSAALTMAQSSEESTIVVERKQWKWPGDKQCMERARPREGGLELQTGLVRVRYWWSGQEQYMARAKPS
jgi:hypothetical protein